MNQERALLLSEEAARRSPSPPPANLSTGVVLTGPLDVGLLENALNEILRRHPSLRGSIFPNLEVRQDERGARLHAFATTGMFESGMYLQSILDDVHLSIQTADLSGTTTVADNEGVRAYLRRQAACRFDYRSPPLMRASLLKLHDNKHLLALVVAQMVCDGPSMGIIGREIRLLYETL